MYMIASDFLQKIEFIQPISFNGFLISCMFVTYTIYNDENLYRIGIGYFLFFETRFSTELGSGPNQPIRPLNTLNSVIYKS